MFFVIIKISDINIAIRINLYTMALFYIIKESSFINFSLLINEHSISRLFMMLVDSSKIYFIEIFYQSDLVCPLMQHSIQIYPTVAYWLEVFDKEIAKLFLIFLEDIPDFVLFFTNLDPEYLVIKHRGLGTLNSFLRLLFEVMMLDIFGTTPFPVFLHNFIQYIIY